MTPEPLKKNRPLAVFPTSEAAKRVAAIFHRKLTTAWNEREIKQFRKLVKTGCFLDLGDLALVELYYLAERRRGERGVHRRDLITLLNNWQGELDRANLWLEAHPPKAVPRKIIPLPTTPSTPPVPLSQEDEERRARFMEYYQAHKKNKAVIAEHVGKLTAQFAK